MARGNCQLQHLSDLEDAALSEVEHALEYIVKMLVEIRPLLVTDLLCLAEDFETMNSIDRWASIGFSVTGGAGFGVTLAQLLGYTTWSFGTPLTIASGLGKGLTNYCVKLDKKDMDEKFAQILRREEKNYRELEQQLGALLKFDKLCIMHDSNAAAGRFFQAFGSLDKSRTTAGYWGKRIKPTYPIHMHEQTVQAGGVLEQSHWGEVSVNEIGQVVTAILGQFTSTNVKNLVHTVIPNILRVMKVVKSEPSLKLAIANAGLALGHEMVLQAGTNEFIANMSKQPLSEQTAQVLERFGCCLKYADDGKSFSLIMDQGCSIADSLVKENGFTKACQNGKTILTSKNLDLADAATRHCASELAPQYCKMSYDTFTKICTAATAGICIYGMYGECLNIVKKWKQECQEGLRLRRVAEAINEATEAKMLSRIQWSQRT